MQPFSKKRQSRFSTLCALWRSGLGLGLHIGVEGRLAGVGVLGDQVEGVAFSTRIRASSTLGRFWDRYQEKVSCWAWRWASRAPSRPPRRRLGQLADHQGVGGGVHGGEGDDLLKGALGQLEGLLGLAASVRMA